MRTVCTMSGPLNGPVVRSVGKALRGIAAKFESAGLALEGKAVTEERREWSDTTSKCAARPPLFTYAAAVAMPRECATLPCPFL